MDMMMRIAITRAVSRNIGSCELSFQTRTQIDLELAREQHRRYEECLADLGCSLHRLAEEPELPDSVFVEDTAVVLDELALITRPGAVSRRREIESIAQALGPYRRLVAIEAPGILDGGDVLCLGKEVFIGLSHRSNETAIRQVRDQLGSYGYGVTGVTMENCLHLKSAITQVSDHLLLINRAWVDSAPFGSMQFIDVDPDEPGAANALRVGDVVIFPSAFPKTRRRLVNQGIAVRSVDASELAKAEGGVTCCSLIFQT
jgi:dimethylargininase